MQFVFLYRLDLILHAYKILFRCDSFGILNFATKQGVSKQKQQNREEKACISLETESNALQFTFPKEHILS